MSLFGLEDGAETSPTQLALRGKNQRQMEGEAHREAICLSSQDDPNLLGSWMVLAQDSQDDSTLRPAFAFV